MLSVIGGSQILKNSPLLLNFYKNHELKYVVETLVNENIFECKHPEEFISISFLSKRGTTHGWHLDDPPYALVIFIEAPSCYNDGGLLEFIPNWKTFCEQINLEPYKDLNQAIKEAQKLGYIQQYQHKSQDAYILRADKNLHRVTELNTARCKRIIINLGWENRDKVEYGNTASLLYNSNNL